MSGLINFESSWDKASKREEDRKCREIILQKAKHKYEKEQKKLAEAKLRGEDSWMLDAVNKRISNENLDTEKLKKRKKEKKKKKKKKKKRSSTDTDSDDSEPQWVEKEVKLPTGKVKDIIGPKLQRDDWMMAPFVADNLPTISRAELRAKKEKEEQEKREKSELANQPGQHKRELNPYWKQGGSGLPEEQNKSASTEIERPNLGSVASGSGSASWLNKALRRCEEQASEENRSLDEIAAERYGSLMNLKSMIKEAEEKDCGSDKKLKTDLQDSYRDRRDRYYYKKDKYEDRRDKYEDRRDKYEDRKDKYEDRRDKYDDRRDKYDDRRDKYEDRRDKYSDEKRRDCSKAMSMKFKKPKDASDSSDSEKYSTVKKKMNVNRFKKPKSEEDSESESDLRVKMSTSRLHKTKQQPSWKKKEFIKVDAKSPARIKEYSSSSSDSSGQSSSEDKEQQTVKKSNAVQHEVFVLTEQEMNQLGAKILKAQIMGNKVLEEELSAKLAAAQKAKEAGLTKQPSKKDETSDSEKVIVLTKTNRKGMVRPLVPEHSAEPNHGKSKKQKVETHTGKKGERVRYFHDDDKYDLKTLVEQEKLGSAEDSNMMFARLAGRSAEKTDDDYQVDDMFLSRASKKADSKAEARDRYSAIMEHKVTAKAMEKCQFCFDKVPKHLIIAIGKKCYLCLPNHTSLTDGHCLIVPMQHVSQGTSIDEDIWEEIQIFRKSLTKMFDERDEDCVFMEMSRNLQYHPHMFMECVNMEKEVGDMAPIYFKKALMESESEWAQNKKVVDISKKDIRHSVPKGFPYFSVDFGSQGGFAHVIEDEKEFPPYFGREIVGGMLDVGPNQWRKPRKENFEDQRKKVLKFAEMFKPYDWTQNMATKREDH